MNALLNDIHVNIKAIPSAQILLFCVSVLCAQTVSHPEDLRVLLHGSVMPIDVHDFT